jgi:glyoxylase-like metal-dependent hydrolase (beta-lactamase superfamily II)
MVLRPRGFLCASVTLSFAIAALGVGTAMSAQAVRTATPIPAAPDFDKTAVQALPVQGNVAMLIGPGSNIAVQTGPDGVLLVDTQFGPAAAAVFDAVRRLSQEPIHTIINTHFHPDHTGATGALVKMRGAGPQAVRVMAHDNVLVRMQRAATAGGESAAALRVNQAIVVPVTSPYFMPSRDFFLNGEAVFLHHVPAAHTDGDTIVHFRKSDVVVTGDVFTPDLYPVVDLQNGGSVNGVIAALNKILEITVPARYQEGGTYVIPGHGRLCDEADVVEYRDMVTIIRDRVQDLIAKKMTLPQVKAARPTRDYDTEYGADSGHWTTEMFVEAVYRSLSAK